MTMMPNWKTCPKCHKRYDYNPDVGQFKCPYCYGMGVPDNPLGRLAKKITKAHISRDDD